jgi:ribonucleoside-diphosphate reductase alpha chain
MKFVDDDGEFDPRPTAMPPVTITAQEILVDNASYPTPKIEENSHKFRPLGLGYANLGALLMSRGPRLRLGRGAALRRGPHRDHDGEAYKQSAIIARDHGGPFAEYARQRGPFLRVIGKHRDAAYRIPAEGVPGGCSSARPSRSMTRRSSSAGSTATGTPRSPSSRRPGRSRS